MWNLFGVLKVLVVEGFRFSRQGSVQRVELIPGPNELYSRHELNHLSLTSHFSLQVSRGV